jgi:hypothetical protein
MEFLPANFNRRFVNEVGVRQICASLAHVAIPVIFGYTLVYVSACRYIYAYVSVCVHVYMYIYIVTC